MHHDMQLANDRFWPSCFMRRYQNNFRQHCLKKMFADVKQPRHSGKNFSDFRKKEFVWIKKSNTIAQAVDLTIPCSPLLLPSPRY